ncbi:hypothetical protein [Streptomyces sp. NPDC020597]|uniref:hypothetical protein n=1 Tax=unclassified Streptomyces TaxID=2593676 RepID=UPI00378FB21E
MNVIIDHNWTMEMWRPVVREFIDLLQAHALSATLKQYALDPEAGTVSPPPPTAPESDARELGIFITDGLGSLWQRGKAHDLLCTWAARQPLGVVHLLPRTLWDSSGIRATRQSFRASTPGQPNTDLQVETQEGISTTFCPVPTLELNQEDLEAWGRLVVQGARTILYCILAQPDAALPAQRQDDALTHQPFVTQQTGQDVRSEALERLELFRTSASREAQFLANALSVLPLNIAVMHRTQESLLPRHGPELFSELFIAQLIHPVVAHERLRRIDRVTFDFAPGVREELVSGLNQQWTGDLFTATAVFLDEDLGIPFVSTWRDLIESPSGIALEEITDVSVPFLRVELTVLEALSGPYRSRARRLREALAHHEESSLAAAAPSSTAP